MTTLAPKPGFDWSLVSWGGPDEPQSDDCFYCDAEIPEEACPLRLWNAEGWAAVFCDDCAERWWGLRKLDEGEGSVAL